MATETNSPAALDADQLVERVQELTDAFDQLDDDRAKGHAEELLGAIMELYAEGLARIIEAVDDAGPSGAEIKERLVDDGVVASLLLIHDLYPVDLETRVLQALDSVRPYMESHGGDVELLGIEDGVARLRLQGSCKGCPASAATLELAIKQAIDEAAPDLQGLEVEGVAEPKTPLPQAPESGFSLPVLNGGPPQTPTWMALDRVGDVEPGALRTVSAGGVELIVANVGGTLLAYRSACAGCGAGLHQALLDGDVLTCPGCGCGFDLPRAGRAVDGGELQLEPVPLLRRAGPNVEVALRS
jgi:Fe-S cluster biogenesis protein NfuA